MPKVELISWSRLTIPSPIVTGSISTKTWRTRGSRQSSEKPSRKSICWSAPAAISSCTTVAARIAIAYA